VNGSDFDSAELIPRNSVCYFFTKFRIELVNFFRVRRSNRADSNIDKIYINELTRSAMLLSR
jgi:hypothetical protein